MKTSAKYFRLAVGPLAR